MGNSVGTFTLAETIFCRSNKKQQKAKENQPMKMRTEFTCPLELVHDMIKGKWKPIILWRLRLGATSLAKLERDIDGITQKMLLEQLKELMDYGFVEKKSYEGYPLRVEYSLTDDICLAYSGK